MPVDKFGRTDEKVVQNVPSVTISAGLTMSQINNTFLRRVGSNTMTADLNLNKHRVINLNKPTAADDAVTRQYVCDTFLKRDGLNAMTGIIDMSKNRLMNLGDPLGEHDAVNLKFLDRFLKHDGSSHNGIGALEHGRVHVMYNQCCPTSFGRGFSDERLRGQCCWFNSS
jgi:hypothetical protein